MPLGHSSHEELKLQVNSTFPAGVRDQATPPVPFSCHKWSYHNKLFHWEQFNPSAHAEICCGSSVESSSPQIPQIVLFAIPGWEDMSSVAWLVCYFSSAFG